MAEETLRRSNACCCVMPMKTLTISRLKRESIMNEVYKTRVARFKVLMFPGVGYIQQELRHLLALKMGIEVKQGE